MYSGVPISTPSSVNTVCSVRRCSVALATPKSMIFGTGLAVLDRHQHVRRLQVAVDDSLLVRVLHALADLHEQLQPFPGAQSMLAVAVTR